MKGKVKGVLMLDGSRKTLHVRNSYSPVSAGYRADYRVEIAIATCNKIMCRILQWNHVNKLGHVPTKTPWFELEYQDYSGLNPSHFFCQQAKGRWESGELLSRLMLS